MAVRIPWAVYFTCDLMHVLLSGPTARETSQSGFACYRQMKARTWQRRWLICKVCIEYLQIGASVLEVPEDLHRQMQIG